MFTHVNLWFASQSASNIRCSKKKSIIFPIDGFSNLYLALYKCDRVTPNGVRKIRFRTKKTSQTVLWLLESVLFERVSKMDTNKEKIRHILQFFFDKGENASQAAENVNSVYGPDTVTVNIAQFWFRRFRSGNFDVKDAPRSGRPIVENSIK